MYPPLEKRLTDGARLVKDRLCLLLVDRNVCGKYLWRER